MTYLVAAAAIAFMGIFIIKMNFCLLHSVVMLRSGGELACPAGGQYVDLPSDGPHPGHSLRSGHQKQEAHPDWSEERDVRPGYLCASGIHVWLLVRLEAQQVREISSLT